MAQKRTTSTGKVRWVGRYRDHTGRAHSRSFDTRREAVAWEEEQRRALRRGEWIDPRSQTITLRTLVTEYQSLASREGTRRDRGRLLADLGPLADMPVTSIRPSHVEAWALALRDGRPWAGGRPLAASTVRVKTGQLRTVMRRAVEDGLIASSPAEALRRFDAGDQAEFYLPTEEEVARLHEHAEGWMKVALRLGAECGLRAGEVCGLRVGDVDFLRRVIHVRVQAEPGKAGGVVPLKSRDSRRDVPVSSSLALALSAELDGRDVGPDDRLLLSERGLPLFSSRVSHLMADTRDAAGVDERVHFHSLRHLYASRLLAAGVALPTVSRLLGHSNPAVTARVYAHHLAGADDALRGVLDSLGGFLGDQAAGEGRDGGTG